MIKTKLTFALLALVAGFAGASQAQAGHGSFQLGSGTFADRCADNGGDLYDLGNGAGCDLGALTIDCSFVGAQTWCEWDGAQNDRNASRVLGVASAQSLSEPSSGGGKKKLKFSQELIDFLVNSK